ncbi:16677_t:CDS:1, partial [Racocetra fulgida]
DYESKIFDYQKAANRDNINILNVDKSKEKDMMVSIVKTNKTHEINDREPEYSPDLNNKMAQKSRVTGKLDNEVGEDEMMILMEALLDVVTKMIH